ncbi:transglutaminase domain-containing protein [Methanomicrobium antiquum]|uniref:Transglutaminase domain-containing protein n=1 Tax=Methanomicrobium antiquum TaxID=487686 RepID=A0AAF0JLR1_9EURY|nr:transglutaminase domain-containing protein [Methanomicrobium antiquum]WFN36372.1 transglutaminase domain-containing protein [Methanomicrobium antiquum]
MKSVLFLVLSVFTLCLVLFCGCTGTDDIYVVSDDAKSRADAIYDEGVVSYSNGDYRTAEEKFLEAQSLYESAGLLDDAKKAMTKSFVSLRSYVEYSLNESEAYASLKEKVPEILDEEISGWLEDSAQKIESDGETLYFYDTAANYLYENYEIIRVIDDRIDFDFLSRDVLSGKKPDGSSPYFNPKTYEGTSALLIPEDFLRDGAIIKVWMPLPLVTESQTNVTVTNLSYSEYIVYGPVTEGQIGYVYYELPADKLSGDTLISADISFTSYEQGFYVDPAKVMPYNKTTPEYILYTKSDRNIEINEDISKLAREIVGDEKNPYLQAVMIYNHIIETYPYSHVPHLSLDTIEPKTAESTHMLNTGRGDCGTQSMLFSALCRSLGIPARAPGGYQMIITDTPGTHFWAMYYIEGYGWIPCDPTVADAADWVEVSEDKRVAFKEYFAHNLDNTRFVIQKDVDAEMSPAIPADAAVFRVVRQMPAVLCDEADFDIDLYSGEGFKIELWAVDNI